MIFGYHKCKFFKPKWNVDGMNSKMMKGSPATWLHGITRKLGSLRQISWLGARSLHHIDRIVYEYSGGQHTAVNLLFGVPALTMTTTGAKSGLPRSVPLIGIPDGNDLILIASNWGQDRNPGWYHNLIVNPLVRVSIDGLEADYLAHEATGEERETYWKKAVAVFGGYRAYQKRVGERQIPVVILSPLN